MSCGHGRGPIPGNGDLVSGTTYLSSQSVRHTPKTVPFGEIPPDPGFLDGGRQTGRSVRDRHCHTALARQNVCLR